MTKFSKGHNSGKIYIFFSFLIWSGNLRIISYQLTKFQAPSLNSFWDILLTSLKCPNFQRAITPEKYNDFVWIWSGNLLIICYQLTKFQAPNSNSFRDILLTILKCPNYQRAITPEKYNDFLKVWSGILLIICYQLTKFQARSSNSSRGISCWKV